MDPQRRYLGYISRPVGPGIESAVEIDFGDLVRKLVLFDQLYIESHNHREPAVLVQKFGYDGAKALFESGRIRLLRDKMFVVEMRKAPGRTRPPLRLGEYAISPALTTPPRQSISAGLHRIDRVSGLTSKQSKKLRELVGRLIVPVPQPTSRTAGEQFTSDLRVNAPMLSVSVAAALRKKYGIELSAESCRLRLEQLASNEWRAESQLHALTGLSEQDVHDVVYTGLAAVACLNVRLAEMQGFDAISAFRVHDLPLFDEKVSFVVRELDPDLGNERFDRVSEIVGLPDATSDPTVHDIDIAALLEITSGDEVREFREWLRTSATMSDSELADAVRPVREAVGRAVRSPAARAVRFATTTGVGVLVPPVGLALSVVDTFLVDKLIPKPGPTAFLSRLARSMGD